MKNSLGQNFIFDSNITNKIAKFADITQDDLIIEIGSGAQTLTKSILSFNPKSLIAIEKDKNYAKTDLKNVAIINSDAIDYDFSQHKKFKVIANLPYNVASLILIKLIGYHKNISSMVLMFQKEVAQRIIAKTGEDYSKLSVISQAFFDVKIVYSLPPSVFTPQPKINSSVVKFIPKKDVICNFAKLKEVTKNFFQYKRKTIRNILSVCYPDNQALFTYLLSYLGHRPEDLTVEDYISITRLI